MNTKPTCRDCGGHAFYSRNVSLRGYLGAILPLGIFAPRDLKLRICGDCGLMDWFVQPSTMEKVKLKLRRSWRSWRSERLPT